MDIFNHYLLKEIEHGITNKIFRKKPTAKIGLSEPEPLPIRSVMFPFSCLGFCMIVSVVMAATEFLVAKVKRRLHRGKNMAFNRTRATRELSDTTPHQ